MIILFFTFLTLSFPKAGILIGGTPITLQEVFFVFSIIKVLISYSKKTKISKSAFILYIVYVCFLTLVTLINLFASNSSNIVKALVLIFSPMAYIIGKNISFEKFMKILTYSVWITTFYGVLQKSFGILTTQISGLNVAYGDSLANKPIGFEFTSQLDSALKMPSTYQNGNGWGLFLDLALILLVVFKPNEKEKKFRILTILVAIFGLVLCGSRTAIISLVLVFFLILFINVIKYNSFSSKKVVIMLFVSIAVIFLIPFIVRSSLFIDIYSRYINSLVEDPTGNGRVPQLSALFSELGQGTLRNYFIGFNWAMYNGVAIEGIGAILAFFGFLGIFIIYTLWSAPIFNLLKKNKLLSFALLTNFIAWLGDGSFNYPPYLINYFFVAGVCIKFYEKKEVLFL